MRCRRNADGLRLPHPRAGPLCALLAGGASGHAPAAHAPPAWSNAGRTVLVSLLAAVASTGEPSLPLVELSRGGRRDSRAAGRSLPGLGSDVGCNSRAGVSASEIVACDCRAVRL